MQLQHRYAMLTVDTEALPSRADSDHVNKLIWGRHAKGTAGVAELCNIGDEYGAKHVFFVDMCGAFTQYRAYKEVVTWLCSKGQDVQLHTHPEYLPDEFWQAYNILPQKRMKMGAYNRKKNILILQHFSKLLTRMTGEPVRAFRAGSFRWNTITLQVLKKLKIPFSFNNSVTAFNQKKCTHSIAHNQPFKWSNGLIEIPSTEQALFSWLANPIWARFRFPMSQYMQFRSKKLSFLPFSLDRSINFLVCVLHSWSLLYLDKQGHFVYKDDSVMEQYHSFLRRLTKDYDVITTADLHYLIKNNKIPIEHTEDISNLPLRILPRRKVRKKPKRRV